MKRATWFSVWGLCVSLSMACGGRSEADRDEAIDNEPDFNLADTSLVQATGCLTASGDRYVLTALDSDATATELYQLVGDNENLQQHVGREVRVTGDATDPQIAEFRESGAGAPEGTSGVPEQEQPQVRTETQTRLETRQLRLGTVTPTGNECAAATEPAP